MQENPLASGQEEQEAGVPAPPVEKPVHEASVDGLPSDTPDENVVPHPQDGELITVGDLSGRTLEFGFDPSEAEVIELGGHLLLSLPNGGLVILEHFAAAFFAGRLPTLKFHGKILPNFKLAAAFGEDINLAPAAETQAAPEPPSAGGTSIYSEDLGDGLNEEEEEDEGPGIESTAERLASEETSIDGGTQDETSDETTLAGEAGIGLSVPGEETGGSAAEPLEQDDTAPAAGGSADPTEDDEQDAQGREGDGGPGGEAETGDEDTEDPVPQATLGLNGRSFEEAAAGVAVGQLTLNDPGGAGGHSFSVDDARFEIVGSELRLKPGVAIDHETEPQVTLSVTATDADGATTSQTFVVTVLDVNEAPTDLALNGSSLAENSAAGTVLGRASVSDPDSGESFLFALTDDAGGRFVIDGSSGEVSVAPGAVLDFESAPSHDITIKVTDSGGESYEESFTVTLRNVGEGADNAAPSGITLNSLSVEEAAAGAIVGRLVVADADEGDEHRFSVSDDRFEVAGNRLKLKSGVALDHESEPQIALSVTATDPGGLSVTRSFTIDVLDVNEAPTDILFGTDVDENAPAGTPVETAQGVDPDVGETFTYALTDDAGGRFVIDSETGEVTVAAGADLDFESAREHDITVRVTDSGGKSYEETFAVAVNDVNEAPTDLALSGSSVAEDSAPGTRVGTVSAQDPDAGDSLTFDLPDDAGGRFAIDGATGELTVAGPLDPADGHDVTVRVTDSGGESYSETFSINVQEADIPDGQWDRIIENLVLNGEGLRLSGHQWDNTLIRNVTILDAPEHGIFLKNVSNVRIEDSTIVGTGLNGVHMSNSGSTEDVVIVGNLIHDTGQNGIHSAQREANGVDHPGVQIIGNTIENTGLNLTHGLHGIYLQSTDFLIEGNTILDTNAGNGISVRSSGIVRDNVVIDVVREESNGGYGIAYFSDHASGPSDTLIIEGNVIDGTSIIGPNGTAIKLLGPAGSEPLGSAGRVSTFIIRDNQHVSDSAGDLGIQIHSEWNRSSYDLEVSGNRQVESLSEAGVHAFDLGSSGRSVSLGGDYSIADYDESSTLYFRNVLDFNDDGVIGLDDVEGHVTVSDAGPSGMVEIAFDGGGSVELAGIGDGTLNSLQDMVDSGYNLVV